MSTSAFTVEAVGYEASLPDLRRVREAVFVQEQGVPLALEWDELDPLCHHVVARDASGEAVGTGRLTPKHTIGRMAVLPDWRDVSLHAQASAIEFYARHGFLPYGERFEEAGIDHQSMRLLLDAVNPVETREAAIAALLGVIAGARRQLDIYSRELDPGLLDAPEVVATLRRLAIAGGEVRVLLQDSTEPQRALAPLISLAQRLPSAFAFRAIEEPTDRSYPSAYVANDLGGYYFRPLGHRFDGETRLDASGRARQLRASFDPVWQRARPCTEYRALGL